MMRHMGWKCLAAILLMGFAGRVFAEAIAVRSVDKNANGITLHLARGVMRVQLWSDRVIRVQYGLSDTLPETRSFSVIAKPTPVEWEFTETPENIVVKTKAMQARINRRSGAVTFCDAAGVSFLSEVAGGGKTFVPKFIAGKSVPGPAQEFDLGKEEAIYGLGQHQDGVMNYVGHSVHLQQKNTDIAVPVLISSNGFGVLWDNASVTDIDVAKTAPGVLKWSSEAADTIAYYVMYGPEIDGVIDGYRTLTGRAPMFGKWAWGLWQSRERFTSQEELLQVAREYRKRGIPIDGMVQDWQYWSPQPWGSHAFGKNFPDPKGMMKELHDANFHAIISVWAMFDQGSKNYDELNQAGGLFSSIYPNVGRKGGNSKWYDAYNSSARKMYWRQMSDEIFSVGLDGWWLDATEPELGGKWGELRDLQTAAGPGYAVYNAFPLMTTSGVYEGQRAQTSDKRVFILTRSAFTGQQRNAAVAWSGDIPGNWGTFKRQIPAGLNFVISGIPYWNTDIGGFFSRPTTDPDYRECFIRWFQFGSFNPMFRVHGTGAQKELWKFGPEAEAILVKYDHLRYRLLPYIYSVAWKVTNENYTMMRPLVMDFRADKNVRSVSDQYMFGPAMMVCPVTEPGDGSATVISSHNLVDKEGNAGALSGTYFQGEAFEDKKLERRDEVLSFAWDKVKREGVGANVQKDPIPGLEMDHFSARWEGSLLTESAGKYRLQLRADDGMRMWVDGKLVIDDWASRKAATKTVTVNLPAAKKVPIKVEYFQDLHDALIELRWQPPAAKNEFTRKVYLPDGAWCDFWTGKKIVGGQTIDAAAPLDTIPLFMRAGSIVPMGPVVQYAAEQAAAPLEMRVYSGADGHFTLYEDENDNYNYEKGLFSTIPITWNEAKRKLTIGQRTGEFPGMVKSRQFKIVWVAAGHGVGVTEERQPDKVVDYSGTEISVDAP
ncbi:hypothetical protein BH10PLA1_BH10PLA1_01060 [soil metagenome]